MKADPRLVKLIEDRYQRQVMAADHPIVVHDADCHIFAFPVVCTCGLFHCMKRLFDMDAIELYKGWEEHLGKHWRRLDQLSALEVPPPPTAEEIKKMEKFADEELRKLFGKPS